MKIGFIGTGSMGSILIEALTESQAVLPSQLIMTNRTIEKAKALQKNFPEIKIVHHAIDVIKEAEVIFLCVKPLQFKKVLEEIRSHCTQDQLLISITSPISVSQLENIVPTKVARIIPSILSRALSGPSLISFGSRCQEIDKQMLITLMNPISTPLEIDEDVTRVASDIVSCGPAFFSYITQRFIDAAVRQTKIDSKDATKLASNMLIGFGKLLEKEIYTLETLQKRVCVPGGITGEGIKVLEAEIGEMFDHLFQQTHRKFEDEREKIKEQLQKIDDTRNTKGNS